MDLRQYRKFLDDIDTLEFEIEKIEAALKLLDQLDEDPTRKGRCTLTVAASWTRTCPDYHVRVPLAIARPYFEEALQQKSLALVQKQQTLKHWKFFIKEDETS